LVVSAKNWTKENRLLRLLKHRWLDEHDAKRLLSKGGLKRIESRVTASERQHSGEIRVCIEAGLPFSYIRRKAHPRERAVAMFGKLGVWDTEHNNGVLIYVLLAERVIEIVADRGLSKRVEFSDWHRIIARLQECFKEGKFEAGLNKAIDAVDFLLKREFATEPSAENNNELPDTPVVG
jgi:uncharacterized membrane protein